MLAFMIILVCIIGIMYIGAKPAKVIKPQKALDEKLAFQRLQTEIKLKTYLYFFEDIVKCYKNGFTQQDLHRLLPNGYLVFENNKNPAPNQVWFFDSKYDKYMDEDWRYLFKYANTQKEQDEIESGCDRTENIRIHMGENFKIIGIKPIGKKKGQILHIQCHSPTENEVLQTLWALDCNPFWLFQADEYFNIKFKYNTLKEENAFNEELINRCKLILEKNKSG